MMSISPPAYTGYIALLEPLTHHCDIVETETKVGPSKIAPAAVHLGAAVGRNRLSGRDLDQIVVQLMWVLRGRSGTVHSGAGDFDPKLALKR